jgi:hypothetical protein
MPDDDVIYTTLVRGWHHAGRLLQGEAAPKVVADVMTTAVCRTLRKAGGCPGRMADGQGGPAHSVEACR